MYLKQHLALVQQLGLLLQVAPDSDSLVVELLAWTNYHKLDADSSLRQRIFCSDCVGKQDFVQAKDLFVSLCKCLHPAMDCMLSDSGLRKQLMDQYDQFFTQEHMPLNSGRQLKQAAHLDAKQSIVEANMLESDDFKAHRRASY